MESQPATEGRQMTVEKVVKLVREGIIAGQADSTEGAFFRSACGAARELGLVRDTLEFDMYVNGYLSGCPGILYVDINGRTCRRSERYVTLLGVGMIDNGWRPPQAAGGVIEVLTSPVVH